MSDGAMMLLGLLAVLAVPALSATPGDHATNTSTTGDQHTSNEPYIHLTDYSGSGHLPRKSRSTGEPTSNGHRGPLTDYPGTESQRTPRDLTTKSGSTEVHNTSNEPNIHLTDYSGSESLWTTGDLPRKSRSTGEPTSNGHRGLLTDYPGTESHRTTGDRPRKARSTGEPTSDGPGGPNEYPNSGHTETIVSKDGGNTEKVNVLDVNTWTSEAIDAYARKYVSESVGNETETIPPNINNNKPKRYIIEPSTDINNPNTLDKKPNNSTNLENTSENSHPGVNSSAHQLHTIDVNSTTSPPRSMSTARPRAVNPWARLLSRAPAQGCELVLGSDLYLCGAQQLQLNGRKTTVTCDYSRQHPLDCSNLPPSRPTAGVNQLYVSVCALPPALDLACVAGTANTLVLQDVPGSLTADNVRGLDAEYIYFMAAPGEVHELPVEAIRALPRLERFRFLQGTDIPLRPAMFPRSPLQFLELATSGITALPRAAFSELHNLTTLSLFSNQIEYIHPEAFEGLVSLRSLVLDGNPLPSMPARLPAPLRDLHLQRTRLPLLGEVHLRGLSDLQLVTISSSDAALYPLGIGPRAFANLPSLGDVTIDSAGVTSLPADLFDNTSAVVNISMQYNSITSLPAPLWPSLQALERLNLSHNNISAFAPNTFGLRALTHLDLSHNRLTSLPDRAFSSLPSLQVLSLSHNELAQLSAVSLGGAGSLRALSLSHNRLRWAPAPDDWGWGESSPLSMLEQLQELDLSYNSISVIYSDWRIVMRHLVRLDLSHNQLTELSQADMQFLPRAPPTPSPVYVDVSYNRITAVQPRVQWREQGGRGQKEGGAEPARIELGHNPLHCDCVLYDFITVVQSHSPKYAADAAVCASPAPLVNVSVARVPPGAVSCPLQEGGVCTCVIRALYHRVECDCPSVSDVPDISDTGVPQLSLRLQAAPAPAQWRHLPALVNRLILTHLNLTDIPNIPTNVTYIDVTHNHIGIVSEDILDRNITLKLANNDINCECFATDNVKLIQKHASKILDYVNMTCSDGTLIKLKDASTLCDVYKSAVSSTVIAVSLILIACLLALAYIYRVEIQVIMYRHKFCLFLLPKEKDDRDKIYDVFVSFTQEDEKFVLNEILPKLTEYVLHVQGRDWEVGGTIPEQIHRSVEQSRRTLIILSENFLRSRWANEVFRSAHAQATNDKRTRAVTLLTDVKRNQLQKDINTFLSLSTFIKYNDFLFVDKLKYALPWKQYNNRLDAYLNDCNRLDNMVIDGDKLNKIVSDGDGKVQVWNNALQVVKNGEGKLVNLAYVKDV